MEKQMSAGLITSARIKSVGSNSSPTNLTVRAALMIRVDHLRVLLKSVEDFLSSTGRASYREFTNLLEKAEKRASAEGLKIFSAYLRSLRNNPDEIEEVRDSGHLPDYIEQEALKIEDEIAILIREIMETKE